MILSSYSCKVTLFCTNSQTFSKKKKKKSSRAHARITYYIKYIVCIYILYGIMVFRIFIRNVLNDRYL